MMEFWNLYLSSFWAWAGITMGVCMIAAGIAEIIKAMKTKL